MFYSVYFLYNQYQIAFYADAYVYTHFGFVLCEMRNGLSTVVGVVSTLCRYLLDFKCSKGMCHILYRFQVHEVLACRTL